MRTDVMMNSIFPQEKISKMEKRRDLSTAWRYFYQRMNIQKMTRGILATAVALALSSCLEINQTVNLKKDGSGTIVEETVLGAQAAGMLQMAALQGGGKAPDMFGEDAAKKRAEKFGKGVTVAKVEKIDQDGRMGTRVTYNYTDINTVKLSMSDGAPNMGAMAPGAPAVEAAAADAKPITFTYADGQLTINLPKPEKADLDAAKDAAAAKPELGPEADQMQAMAMQMMKDMKMSAKIVIEPGIDETDATYHDGNTITLMQMEMAKLMEDPEMMKKMQNLDMKDPAEFEKKLKGIGGIKSETKEKITVKVK